MAFSGYQARVIATLTFTEKNLTGYITFLILKDLFHFFYYQWLIVRKYTFQRESTLHSFRTPCSKQVQYLKFK